MKIRHGLAVATLFCSFAGASTQSTEPVAKTVTDVPADETLTAPVAAPTLPSGTVLKVKLETQITTSTSKVGDPFTGRITENVVSNNKIIIPVGASVQGFVVKVTSPRRIKGLPTIDLRPYQVTMPTGEKYTMNAAIVDTDRGSKTRVNEEGKIVGEGHSKRDLQEIAIGTGVGMGVGGMVDGVKGAVVGTTIGATITAVHWLARHRNTELAPGTEITMELNHAMTLKREDE